MGRTHLVFGLLGWVHSSSLFGLEGSQKRDKTLTSGTPCGSLSLSSSTFSTSLLSTLLLSLVQAVMAMLAQAVAAARQAASMLASLCL
jgi:hypothetical protein